MYVDGSFSMHQLQYCHFPLILTHKTRTKSGYKQSTGREFSNLLEEFQFSEYVLEEYLKHEKNTTAEVDNNIRMPFSTSITYRKLWYSSFVASQNQVQKRPKSCNAAPLGDRQLLMNDAIPMGYQQKCAEACGFEENA